MRRRRRRRLSRLLVLFSVAVSLAAAGFVLVSPRHRTFYGRLVLGAPSTRHSLSARSLPGADGSSGAGAIPSSSPPSTGGSLGFSRPIPPEVTRGVRPEAPPEARRPQPPAPARPAGPSLAPSEPEAPPRSPRSAVSQVAAVPRTGPGDRVVVKIAGENTHGIPLATPPPGWELKEFAGHARVGVVKEAGRAVLHLESDQASFALYRDVALDLKHFPLLSWSWKVTKLPVGGDVRARSQDDQAAQVYVIFPRWPFPRIHSDVLGYIWDTRAPVGLKVTSAQAPNVKLVVLQSGEQRLGQWVQEERNVYQDYVELLGREPPRVGKIAIMIDSNDTRSQAEAFVDDLIFLRAPPGGSRP